MRRKLLVAMALMLIAVVAVTMAAGCSSSSKTTPTSPTSPSSSGKSTTYKKYTQSQTNITAKVGELFIIELTSNATTGYQWQITGPISPAVQKVSQAYVPNKNPSSAVGVGGVQDFTFKAVSAGQALLQFEYLQAGSNTNGGNANFNVTVTQ